MNNNPLAFSIQTMQTIIGNGLRSITPDKNGVYKGVPLAVIGKPSRNNVLYDPPSFVESITNPESRFYKSLVGGGLEGEWGHPAGIGLDQKAAIARTLQIDSNFVSHYFTKIYSRKTADGKYYIVYGDVVPFGPNGKYLAESFADPKRNTAFSLRSLTSNPEPSNAGYVIKKILALITFDAVSTPGFEEASKCFMDVGNEHFSFEMSERGAKCVSAEDLCAIPNCAEVIGCETINNQSLLDMLQTDTVTIKTHNQIIVGKFDNKSGGLITGQKALSAFHSLYS